MGAVVLPFEQLPLEMLIQIFNFMDGISQHMLRRYVWFANWRTAHKIGCASRVVRKMQSASLRALLLMNPMHKVRMAKRSCLRSRKWTSSFFSTIINIFENHRKGIKWLSGLQQTVASRHLSIWRKNRPKMYLYGKKKLSFLSCWCLCYSWKWLCYVLGEIIARSRKMKRLRAGLLFPAHFDIFSGPKQLKNWSANLEGTGDLSFQSWCFVMY